VSENQPHRHWHRAPADSTHRFAAAAPLSPTRKGLQVAIEVIAYPDGQVGVATSRISGSPGRRTIVQAQSLMFNDIDETKDAIDLILDHLSGEARKPRAPSDRTAST
jgi:hypothetical protein